MIVCAFDTETTGKADWKLAPHHQSQPRVVQVACVLFDDDDGFEIGSLSLLIKPDGWTVPAEAEKVHGISTAFADAYGIRVETAVRVWAGMLRAADRHVCHNLDFDWLMFQIEMVRAGLDPAPFKRDQFCTMRKATGPCAIPWPRGPKWPTLAEAYSKLLGRPMPDGAHDAMVDVRACIEVYQWLVAHEAPKQGVLAA